MLSWFSSMSQSSTFLTAFFLDMRWERDFRKQSIDEGHVNDLKIKIVYRYIHIFTYILIHNVNTKGTYIVFPHSSAQFDTTSLTGQILTTFVKISFWFEPTSIEGTKHFFNFTLIVYMCMYVCMSVGGNCFFIYFICRSNDLQMQFTAVFEHSSVLCSFTACVVFLIKTTCVKILLNNTLMQYVH